MGKTSMKKETGKKTSEAPEVRVALYRMASIGSSQLN